MADNKPTRYDWLNMINAYFAGMVFGVAATLFVLNVTGHLQ